jgi:lipoprotein-anchoring transpeptidase ErfK/SrfK
MSKKIVVNLHRQRLFAYEDSRKVYEYDCVSGDDSHPTDIGTFQILSKHQLYTSHKYGVPMNFAMFFTTDGKAIHQSHLVGPLSYLKAFGMDSVGSHVRLTEEDARQLFAWAPLRTPVEIRGV